jgi:hypothetical protein
MCYAGIRLVTSHRYSARRMIANIQIKDYIENSLRSFQNHQIINSLVHLSALFLTDSVLRPQSSEGTMAEASLPYTLHPYANCTKWVIKQQILAALI